MFHFFCSLYILILYGSTSKRKFLLHGVKLIHEMLQNISFQGPRGYKKKTCVRVQDLSDTKICLKIEIHREREGMSKINNCLFIFFSFLNYISNDMGIRFILLGCPALKVKNRKQCANLKHLMLIDAR